MIWARGPLAAFDIESTGVDAETARIVSATVADIRPGEQTEVASHLIAVDVDIPQDAVAVHGITTEHARANGKPAPEILDAVAAHLVEAQANAVPIVGTNVCYDLTLLDRELRRHNLPTLEDRLGRPVGAVADVYVIDKAVDKYRPGKRKLADLCGQYGARHDGAHDAEHDAVAAARVLYLIARRAAFDGDQLHALYADRRFPMNLVRAFQALGRMSAAELHAAQVRWYADQARDFAAYLRREAHEMEVQLSAAADAEAAASVTAEAEALRARADAVGTDWSVTPFVAVA